MTFIITYDSVDLLMDARRYDLNADQLSQILWHFTKLEKSMPPHGKNDIDKMTELILDALYLNDKLGKMAEKGLI